MFFKFCNKLIFLMIISFFVGIYSQDGIFLPFNEDDDIILQQAWTYEISMGGSQHRAFDFVKGKIDQSSTWESFRVLVSHSGIVKYIPQNASGGSSSWGNRIDHYFSINGDDYKMVYAHLAGSPHPINVEVNINAGDFLGMSGISGAANNVNHLHWEIYKKIDNAWVRIDPYGIAGLNDVKYRSSYYPNSSLGSNHIFATNPPSSSHYLTIAYEYTFPNHSSQGWKCNWDVKEESGNDQNTWQVRVDGPNPGISSPVFTKTLEAKSTIMEFSIKAGGTTVNPVEDGEIWVKDEGGSWNNPISLTLYNHVYGYNNGNFNPGDYNIYYVDFHDIRAPMYVNQYGELEIKQFSIDLTEGAGGTNEYWVIDWLRIYSKNGDGTVHIAGGGGSGGGSGGGGSSGGGGGGTNPPPPPPEPRYEYVGSFPCEGIVDGSIEWTKEPVNIKSNFTQGEDAHLLVQFNKISVDHRIKVDIYKDDVFSWTWGGTYWVEPNGATWDYSYATPCQSECWSGEYEFKVLVDTGNGFYQIDSKKINVSASGERFFYSGSWTCEQIDDGPIEWSKKATNQKTYFEKGEDINLLVEYKNIFVDHCHKVDVYKDGVYSWTWGGTYTADVGEWGWGYSYATPCQANAFPGEYEFKILIDTGDGFEQIDSKTCTVRPGDPFNYGGAWTCPSFTDGTEQWSKVAVDPKETFSQSESIWLLLELKDVMVNHRFKTEVYQNGIFWWDYVENWRDVGEWGWGYSYFTPCQGPTTAGNYEFKVYLDTGSGFQLFETKAFTVN